MQKYVKCLWSVKNKYTRKPRKSPIKQDCLEHHYIHVKLWTVAEKGVPQNEVMALLWGCGKSFSCFLNSVWCCLIDFIYSLKGKQSQCLQSRQCGAVLTFCQQMEMPHFLFSASSCYQQKALVSAWRSSRFSAFLFKYVTMIAPAPKNPGSYFWSSYLVLGEQIEVL